MEMAARDITAPSWSVETAMVAAVLRQPPRGRVQLCMRLRGMVKGGMDNRVYNGSLNFRH